MITVEAVLTGVQNGNIWVWRCLISAITILRTDLEITRTLCNLSCRKTFLPPFITIGQTRIYNSNILQRTI